MKKYAHQVECVQEWDVVQCLSVCSHPLAYHYWSACSGRRGEERGRERGRGGGKERERGKGRCGRLDTGREGKERGRGIEREGGREGVSLGEREREGGRGCH